MNKVSIRLLYIFILISSMEISAQTLAEITETMAPQVNKSLIIDKIREYKKKPLSEQSKAIRSITADSLDDISLIFYLSIYPDFKTNEIAYSVDKDIVLLYMPFQPYFYLWDTRNQMIGIAPLVNKDLLKSWYNYQFKNVKSPSSSFLIYFFPLDKGRRYIVAFNRDNDEKYEYTEIGYNMYFKDINSLFKYYFYSSQNYIDIYTTRWNYNFGLRRF